MPKESTTTENGSMMLGIVFGLGMLGIGIAASTLLFATNSVTDNAIAGSGVRSLITADSASREGIYRVLKDYADDDVVTFTGTSIPLLNGTASADVTVSGTWPIYEIKSTSNNPRTTRVVVATLDLFPSAFAFDQAVYTNGSLELTGSGQVNGDVYATEGIDFSSGGSNVDGNAYSPNGIDEHNDSSVAGEDIDNYGTVLPPDIDTTPYFTEATTNGDYYADGTTAGNVLKNANSAGTFYIDDSVEIEGATTNLDGTLVVDGDLTLKGGTYTADSSNPLVIYVTGNLTLSGGVEVNGIIFVEGETSVGTGNAEITGSLISVNSGNSMTVTGSFDVTYDPTYAEDWQDIVGIDTESGTDPSISDWHEE